MTRREEARMLLKTHSVSEVSVIMGVSQSTVERYSRGSQCDIEGSETTKQYAPKILLFDIETAPMISYMWALHNEIHDMNFVEKDWYMMCFAWKWLGGETTCHSLLHYKKTYKEDKENDVKLLEILHGLFDKADIVIGHNAQKFDVRKVNARFIAHGLTPPSPYRIVDTLKVARRHFKFSSNKLGDLGEALGLGSKVDTGGFDLWKGCLAGDRDSWSHMEEYNIQDVDLLELVYLKLAPYMNNHPNFGAYTETLKPECPLCGGDVTQKGYTHTNLSMFVRYQCKECGYWGRGRKNLLDKEKRDNLITSIR